MSVFHKFVGAPWQRRRLRCVITLRLQEPDLLYDSLVTRLVAMSLALHAIVLVTPALLLALEL